MNSEQLFGLKAIKATAKLDFYWVFLFLLLFVLSAVPANAQQNLQGLLGKLEQIQTGGPASSGNAASRQGNRGAEGEDLPLEEIEIISPFVFEAREKKVIHNFCTSDSDAISGGVADLDGRFSKLEQDYCKRISSSIFQYGYNLFGVNVSRQYLGRGAIRHEYVLGVGDEVVVSFIGHLRSTIYSTVDDEGRLIIGDFPALNVIGMTLSDLRRWVEKQTDDTMFKTRPLVSLGAVRSTSITVAGEVRKPGVHRLTSLSSVLDAINKAGGINKTGSLRKIQIFRGEEIKWIDIYDILLGRDGGQDLSIRDGDRIVVPLIGKTVAIAGEVFRPGIFELAEGQHKISLADVMELSGGSIRPTTSIIRQLKFEADGSESSVELGRQTVDVNGGDVILVSLRQNIQLGTVELSGHVRTPGTRALASAPTIRTLVGGKGVFKENPYLLFGVLDTTDPATLSRRHFPINLQKIIAGELDYALREDDKLFVFSHSDIRFLTSLSVREILQPTEVSSKPVNTNKIQEVVDKVTASSSQSEETTMVSSNTQITRNIIRRLADRGLIEGKAELVEKIEQDLMREEGLGCRGLQALSKVVSLSGAGRFKSAFQEAAIVSLDQNSDHRACPRIFDKVPDLLPFTLEHLTAIKGEIRVPGAYPVTPDTPLSSLIAVVGGMTKNADMSIVELSSNATDKTIRQSFDLTKVPSHSIAVSPGDALRFSTRFTDQESGWVYLSGEFLRTGRYDLLRGERLSEVIARAGGLTNQAYPYGAVFTRVRVKEAQKAGFQRAARELSSSAFSASSEQRNENAVLMLQKVTEDIKNADALGRVVIESDPTVLQVRPELDAVLEPGDKVFMPKRPSSVMVIGDVLNPGAQQFISGSKVDQYVQQAGGMQKSADEDRIFLVYPNGAAQPISINVWNYNPIQVPPGSTIVVPRNLDPLDIFEFAKDITSLISQMAITAASLAVIGNN